MKRRTLLGLGLVLVLCGVGFGQTQAQIDKRSDTTDAWYVVVENWVDAEDQKDSADALRVIVLELKADCNSLGDTESMTAGQDAYDDGVDDYEDATIHGIYPDPDLHYWTHALYAKSSGDDKSSHGDYHWITLHEYTAACVHYDEAMVFWASANTDFAAAETCFYDAEVHWDEAFDEWSDVLANYLEPVVDAHDEAEYLDNSCSYAYDNLLFFQAYADASKVAADIIKDACEAVPAPEEELEYAWDYYWWGGKYYAYANGHKSDGLDEWGAGQVHLAEGHAQFTAGDFADAWWSFLHAAEHMENVECDNFNAAWDDYVTSDDNYISAETEYQYWWDNQ